MQNQNQEVINLHATSNELQTQIMNLNVYIMQLMRNLIKTHIIKQKKKLIAHSKKFKNDKKKSRKIKNCF